MSTEIRHATYVDRRPIPFKTFATEWLMRTRPTVSPNTHGVHARAVNGYLVPAFNLMAVQRFMPDRIERWQAELLSKGKPGPRSVEIFRTTLSTMLKDARKKGRLYVNPVTDVRRFDVPKKEMHYLNAEQVKALCETVLFRNGKNSHPSSSL